jgi:WD40 repeat protein
MNRQSFLLLIIFFIFSFVSCSKNELPYYGVFLKEKSDYIQMIEFEGPPDISETEKIPVTDNSQPVILVWRPDIVLRYLELQSDAGDGDNVEYNVAPGQQEGALEISPRASLSSGIYCLVQGDPLGAPYGLLHWCFEISSTKGESTTNKASQSDFPVIDSSNVHLLQPLTIHKKVLLFNVDVDYLALPNIPFSWHTDPDELRICKYEEIILYDLKALMLKETIILDGICRLITPDGKIAVIEEEENSVIILYDINSGKNLYEIPIETRFGKGRLFPDGKLMVAGEGPFYYIDIDSGEIVYQKPLLVTEETQSQNPFRYCRAGSGMNSERYGAFRELAKGEYSHVIKICDFQNQEILHEIPIKRGTGTPRPIAFSSDDNFLYYLVAKGQEGSSTYDVSFYTFDVRSGKLINSTTFTSDHSSVYGGTSISPDGKLLLVLPTIIDSQSGEILHQLPINNNDQTFANYFSPDGRFIVTYNSLYAVVDK